jgi:hypothetical protein
VAVLERWLCSRGGCGAAESLAPPARFSQGDGAGSR